MVGDNLTADVDGAENAGIPGILVRTPDSHGQVLGLLDAAEKIIASVAHRVQSAGATADEIPAAVWQRAGVDPGEMHQVDLVSLDDGTGAASGQVQLITATFREGYAARLVRKTFRRLTSGPHAEASRHRDHWAYWRRELMAYRSGLLPTGSGLRAPRLYGTADNALYIEWVGGQQPTAADAATALGRWHCADHVTDHAAQFPWLARHQLGQRLDVSDLDWTTVDLDRRLRELWNQRHEYLSALEKLPWCITHGDFSIGNLRAFDGDVVALDWATLGVSPVGFDIAHLALATLDYSLLSNYLDGLDGRYGTDDVDLGYRIAVGLVGASRAHWMATRSIPLPSGYADFVIIQGP